MVDVQRKTLSLYGIKVLSFSAKNFQSQHSYSCPTLNLLSISNNTQYKA